MTGNTMLIRIAIAALMVVVVFSSPASEEVLVRKERSAEQLKDQGSPEIVSHGNNTVQSNPLDYTIKLSMVNYGSTTATVQQRYLFPDGVEVKSYSLNQRSENGTRTKRSAENQRLTQWVGGEVNLKKMDEKDAEMIYINHPEQVINLQSKTFHKLAAAIMVKQCDTVGGEIFSPNYPVRYPNGADISWLIAYPEGNRVRLEMEDFSTEECCDRVTVYDGYNKSHSTLATFDGEFYPSPDNVVLSTKPAMFITFISDCLGTSRGFRAKYINQKDETPSTTPSPPMSCGSVQMSSGNSGYVYSPNYPGTYGENMNCTWSVQTYYGTRVKFVFENFSLSYGDYLSIYEGTPNNPGYRIARFSGNIYPGYSIYANSNRAFLVFTSDSYSYYGNKFLISYYGLDNSPQTTTPSRQEPTTVTEAASCGEVQSNSLYSGYIYSPDYPGMYPPNMNCTWSVQTAYGTRVRFYVQYFNIRSGDYLYIYDGTTYNPGRMLKRMSGYYSSGYTVTADSNRAFLVFTTDYYSSYGYKFSLYYYGTTSGLTTVAPVEETSAVYYSPGQCYATMYEYTSGDIESPGYYSPGYYPNNERCTWYVSVSSWYVVRFYVHYFSTEYGYDYVRIYNGYSTYSGNLISVLSGYIPSGTVLGVTNSRYATVTFNSDSIVPDNGFDIHYSGVYPTVTTTPATSTVEMTTANWTLNCDGPQHVYGSYGYLYSPNYPNYYYDNMNCSTWLSTPYNTLIRLTVQSFSLNSGDYVTVYNGFNNQYLRSFVGYYSYGNYWDFYTNYIKVVFTSNSYYTSSGYSFRYDAIYDYYYYTTQSTPSDTNCGQEMPQNYGTILSPNYPTHYYNNLDCVWTVQVYSYRYVLFTIQYFDTETGYDYVGFYRGTPSASEGRVQQCSGYQPPGAEILIRDYQAYVTFHTDGSVMDKGFNITYSAVYTSYVPAEASTESNYISQPVYGTDAYTYWMRMEEKEAKVRPKVMGIDLWEGAKNRPLRRKMENLKQDAEPREIPGEEETLQ